MRILIFGAGAMGSFFGALLSRRNRVTLVGRPLHMKAVRDRGLRITGKTSLLAKPAAAVTRVPPSPEPDLIMVTTKAYDTGAAMHSLRPFARTAIFLTVQNGLDNPEIIAQTAKRVAAGTTSHGVTFVGPGEVRHAGVGDTVIGAWSAVDEADLVRLRDVFEEAGIPTHLSSDPRTELWAKVIVNASINPLAALAGVANGRLVRDRRLRTTLEAVCREAAAAARADGAAIDPTDIVQRTITVARRTAANRASMLQDLDRGHRTEIDAISGAVIRVADRHRLPVPVNRTLYALVRAREAEFPRSS